jgi:hypothetical protein
MQVKIILLIFIVLIFLDQTKPFTTNFNRLKAFDSTKVTQNILADKFFATSRNVKGLEKINYLNAKQGK